MHKAVVFDFDGTWTRTVAGADEAFAAAHAAGLARLTDSSASWMTTAYADALKKIVADPTSYGWNISGRIVAPATVDGFVKARVMAQIVLGGMGQDPADWNDRLDRLYQENYLVYETELRPELLEVLHTLRAAGTPFNVVTNSDPEKVCKRLAVLGEEAKWINPLVRGFAKKFIVTSGPETVPEHIFFPGLERPIFLRKQHYYNVLEEIANENDLSMDRLVLVGDIAELDLVMGVTLGAQGYLMLGDDTMSYERHWAEEHPNVSTITDLRQILA